MSSSFELGFSGRKLWGRHDRLSLRLSQPLRVESGDASLRWVAGRTRGRQVRMAEERLSLEPSARQLNVELAYALPVYGSGLLNVAALGTRNLNHNRGRTGLGLVLRYQRTW